MTVRTPNPSTSRVVVLPTGNWLSQAPRQPAWALPEPPEPEPRRGEVNWYVPYTVVHPLTVEAVPRDATWVDVSSSPESYYGALAAIWERGETFAILEHDVVCRPDVIEEFENCPEPWCLFGYQDICCPGCQENWRNQLGCTRFRAELMDAVPDALAALPEERWDWHNVCDGLGDALRAAGFTHHWHGSWEGGWVEHHHGVQRDSEVATTHLA